MNRLTEQNIVLWQQGSWGLFSEAHFELGIFSIEHCLVSLFPLFKCTKWFLNMNLEDKKSLSEIQKSTTKKNVLKWEESYKSCKLCNTFCWKRLGKNNKRQSFEANIQL